MYRKDNNNFDFIQGKTELIKFKSEQAVYDYMVGIYHGFMKQYYEIINNETVKAINNLNWGNLKENFLIIFFTKRSKVSIL